MSREKGHGMPCPYEPNGLQFPTQRGGAGAKPLQSRFSAATIP